MPRHHHAVQYGKASHLTSHIMTVNSFGHCVMPMGTSYCPAMHWGMLGVCSVLLLSPQVARLPFAPHYLGPLPSHETGDPHTAPLIRVPLARSL